MSASAPAADASAATGKPDAAKPMTAKPPVANPAAAPFSFFGIGRDQIIFSVKAFLGGMLALWLALVLDLQKPYWAMMTAYIVAQPLAAAVTSKAVFRVMGTFVGAAATLVLVPNLVETPELLCLALSLWVGGCLFVSLLDRTPRSYVAMLAGYTAAIIGFMSVGQPTGIFETTLSRTEEITLGILCSALVSRLVFPRHLGPMLAARLNAWVADAGQWACDVLSGREETVSLRDRRRLATDTVDMLALTTHLPYDTTALKYAARQVLDLQQHMTALLPILSGLDDRLKEMRADAPLDPRLERVLEAVARWIASDTEADEEEAERLKIAITGLSHVLQERPEDTPLSWREMLAVNLLSRLVELVEVWANCLSLRREIAGAGRAPKRSRRAVERYAGVPHLHVDVGSAARAGLAVTVATMICCMFWIATGWHDGGGAAQMAAILCSLFAFMDNPLPMMRIFARYTAVAIVMVGAFQFTLMPHLHGLDELILAMAPYLLFFGALMATPKWGMFGFMMCVNLPMVMMLDARPSVDFSFFINNNVATLVGIVIATATAATLLTIGTETSVSRLLRANRADLAQIARQRRPLARAAFMRRLVDRFGLAVQRIVALPAGTSPAPEQVLAELRVGLNIADLQRVRGQLTLRQQAAVTDLLDGLSGYFNAGARRRLDNDAGEEEAMHLLPLIDRALTDLAGHCTRSDAVLVALRSLVGIRHALLPAAPKPQMQRAADWSLAT